MNCLIKAFAIAMSMGEQDVIASLGSDAPPHIMQLQRIALQRGRALAKVELMPVLDGKLVPIEWDIDRLLSGRGFIVGKSINDIDHAIAFIDGVVYGDLYAWREIWILR